MSAVLSNEFAVQFSCSFPVLNIYSAMARPDFYKGLQLGDARPTTDLLSVTDHRLSLPGKYSWIPVNDHQSFYYILFSELQFRIVCYGREHKTLSSNKWMFCLGMGGSVCYYFVDSDHYPKRESLVWMVPNICC